MVDFQSRDTDRGLGDDDDDDPDEGPDAEGSGTDDPGDTPDDDHDDHDTPDDGNGHGDDHDHGDDGHGDDHDHDHHAHDVAALGVAVVTVTSTRTSDDDPAGDAIADAVEREGHEVTVKEIVRDDYDGVQNVVDALTGRGDVDAVVTTGGTGVTPDDVTIEAVRPLFDKTLPGFGELFRTLSYDEIGTKVVGTRATAGIVEGVPVFCLPGSENAATLGAEEIIVEEAPHLAGLATRDEPEE
ncbi:MogA/MoaB family molybdenum cofactor biosynthesis protein [Halorientalis marina]|uniref:MogA/MoaB family molybdenum cofactor biosynthesis protein n=1 Tax=Halorientalis marina TaxID=2931976 RepID=UPI001FF3266C|nr:molybdenum cofactor synthesis domain-containing protein [Halorientalis marina]